MYKYYLKYITFESKYINYVIILYTYSIFYSLKNFILNTYQNLLLYKYNYANKVLFYDIEGLPMQLLIYF